MNLYRPLGGARGTKSLERGTKSLDLQGEVRSRSKRGYRSFQMSCSLNYVQLCDTMLQNSETNNE